MTIPSIDSINVHSTTHNIMTSCLSKATATCDKKKKKTDTPCQKFRCIRFTCRIKIKFYQIHYVCNNFV